METKIKQLNDIRVDVPEGQSGNWKIEKFTVNKSTFVHKTSREQFEMRTHQRLIDITETTTKTIESLSNLSLPAGVEIEIKMLQ